MNRSDSGDSVVVIYDAGAASPLEILDVADNSNVVFAVPEWNEHTEAVRPLLELSDPVLDIANRPPADATELIGMVAPAGVTTFSEKHIPLAARIARDLGLPGHTERVVEQLTNKWLQRVALRAAGVDRTRSALITSVSQVIDAVAQVGLPAVLKPAVGSGSRNTFAVTSVDEAHQIAGPLLTNGREAEMVLEEMLEGDDSIDARRWGDIASVETIVMSGRIQHLCISGRLPTAWPFRETGTFMPHRLAPDLADALADLATRAIRAIGVRVGLIHTEMKLTPDGPRLIEINGRLGGYINDLLVRGRHLSPVALGLQAAVGVAPAVRLAQSGKVVFRYHVPVPTSASEVVSIDGVDAVRQLPFVRRFDVAVRAGSKVDWRIGLLSAVGEVFGETETHEGLLQAVRQIERTFQVVYR